MTERDLFLAEVLERVEHAHGLLAPLLGRQLPRAARIGVLGAALSLREVLRMAEAERAGLPRPLPVSGDCEAFALFVARDQGAPARLRLLAQRALAVRRGASPARQLAEIFEHCLSLRELLGVDLEEAARRVTEAQEWRELPPARVALAVAHTFRALDELGRRP